MAYTSEIANLKCVLDKFGDPNYKPSDDIYLEKLLKHLSVQPITSDHISVCCDWFHHIVQSWKSNVPNVSISAFAVRLLSILTSYVEHFITLQKNNSIDILIQILNLNTTENSFLKLAYISMLSSIAKHKEGCLWIIETELWKSAINLSQQDRSLYVVRETYNFISCFLNSVESENHTKCEEILTMAFSPLLVRKTRDDKDSVAIDADDMQTYQLTLISVINLICHILEVYLNNPKSHTSTLIVANFDLESIAWSLLNTADDLEFQEHLSKLLLFIYFTNLNKESTNAEEPERTLNDFKKKILNLLQLLILKKTAKIIFKVIVQCLKLRFKVANHFEAKGNTVVTKQYQLENQLITILLMPVFCCLTTKTSESDFLDHYYNKLFELTCEATQRLCFLFRENIAQDKDHSQELAHNAVLSILQCKDIMQREQAVIIFQALMYMLKEFVPKPEGHSYCEEYQYQNPDDLIIQFPDLLSSVLESLTCLISCFRITWRESVESICLCTFMIYLLKSTNLTSKLAVQTLKLMQIVIQNFMPPNLALLVNTMEGSSISLLGPSLHKRLHDVSWEVRDSALEVLQVVTCIAEIKFTAFQDHLIENQLLSLVVTMSMNDSESYVRASALKCLSTMVKIEKFWTEYLESQKLPDKMILILHNESEGIVRREAAVVMTSLFHHQNIPKTVMDLVFGTMSHSATNDLHWEVQINALEFWGTVIDHQMTNQGMIDGCFPSVTFSKENRKIVTLTENEIKIRLKKVLQELSRIGCLQVLLTTLHDYNLRVLCKSVDILKSLTNLLVQHNIIPSTPVDSKVLPDLVKSSFVKRVRLCDSEQDTSSGVNTVKVPCRTAINMEVDSFGGNKCKTSSNSDKVIDSIMNESDFSLLEKVYQTKMNITDTDVQVKRIIVISPEEFLSTISTINFNDIISERSRWLDLYAENFNSLLEDILSSNKERELNALDCY